MDFASLGIASVAGISVICYLIGEIVKATGLDNKWIPAICGVVGLALGIVGMFVMPEFPADDFMTAAAIGIVSGWAATGANQFGQKIINTVKGSDK